MDHACALSQLQRHTAAAGAAANRNSSSTGGKERKAERESWREGSSLRHGNKSRKEPLSIFTKRTTSGLFNEEKVVMIVERQYSREEAHCRQ